MWNFKLPEKGKRPRYLCIADHIEEFIVSGKLPPGSRLLPLRELARKMGVTVATLSKAYTEVARRGLIKKHVGRGTFVLGHTPSSSHAQNQRENRIDFGTIRPLRDTSPSVTPILQKILHEGDPDELVTDLKPFGQYRHREIGAAWLCREGLRATADSVLIANGQQHALSSIVSGLFKAGDRVGTGQFSNTGFQMLMKRNGINLVSVAMDDEGLLPGHLDELCETGGISGLFIMENTLNPSAKLPSDKRREEIREVVARHNLTVVQDGSFRWMESTHRPAFSSLLPDQCVYYSGLGPAIYSGLRVAFIHAPEKFHNRIAQAIIENIWSIAPLCVEIACIAISDGAVNKSIKNKLKEMERRIEVVKAALAGFTFTCSPECIYVWLFLPDTWQAKEFEHQAEVNGVKIFAAERFLVGPSNAPNCVRLSLTGPRDIPSLKRGLDILVDLLKKESSLITPIW